MLIVAMPKSASTALLNTLCELHGKGGGQITSIEGRFPQCFSILSDWHSDIREVPEPYLTTFSQVNSFYKQHIPPTTHNMELFSTVPKVILLREPVEIVEAYFRAEKKKLHKQRSEFSDCVDLEDWKKKAIQIGLLNELQSFYDKWIAEHKQNPQASLIINYKDLIKNPKRTINTIEDFFRLNISKQVKLKKARYSRESVWIIYMRKILDKNKIYAKFKKSFSSIAKNIAHHLGYNSFIFKLYSKKSSFRTMKNLNIGCGSYVIDGFINMDIHTEHYHSKNKKNNAFVEYDLRKDSIPFEDNEIDNIYISHVIEHIESDYVYKFIVESYRVLKTRGVLRIACPDAEFLYEVSMFQNQYWSWRQRWFQGKNAKHNLGNPSQRDYLIRELSTPRSIFYVNNIPSQAIKGDDIKHWSYEDLINMLPQDLQFRQEHPGDHINTWDFNRLKNIGRQVGFSYIIRSKPGGSVSKDMQGPDMDKTHPQMTLYVEMIK